MTLHELNTLEPAQLKAELFKCCGSREWVKNMMPYFPADDLVELLEDAEEQWWLCNEKDWKEAFSHHPKIGDMASLKKKFASTADSTADDWASGEQSGMNTANEETFKAFSEANKLYEEKFGYIFIICATGKSAEEMLTILQTRLQNSPEVEIQIAADEQNQITKLRLEKLLNE
jgi:2-oxo-4-hydroxy-4-carboxy-5-ureidoimidazoline decarboxylase